MSNETKFTEGTGNIYNDMKYTRDDLLRVIDKNMDEFIKLHDENTQLKEKQEKLEKILAKADFIYCPECGNCGEEGCCGAINEERCKTKRYCLWKEDSILHTFCDQHDEDK